MPLPSKDEVLEEARKRLDSLYEEAKRKLEEEAKKIVENQKKMLEKARDELVSRISSVS